MFAAGALHILDVGSKRNHVELRFLYKLRWAVVRRNKDALKDALDMMFTNPVDGDVDQVLLTH
jgi:hypothetical protein